MILHWKSPVVFFAWSIYFVSITTGSHLAYRIVTERDLAISYSRSTLIQNSLVIVNDKGVGTVISRRLEPSTTLNFDSCNASVLSDIIKVGS